MTTRSPLPRKAENDCLLLSTSLLLPRLSIELSVSDLSTPVSRLLNGQTTRLPPTEDSPPPSPVRTTWTPRIPERLRLPVWPILSPVCLPSRASLFPELHSALAVSEVVPGLGPLTPRRV
jgi:hypothetical protein